MALGDPFHILLIMAATLVVLGGIVAGIYYVVKLATKAALRESKTRQQQQPNLGRMGVKHEGPLGSDFI